MSYRPGQVGLSEGLGLVFILTIPRVFLTPLSSILEQAGQFGWISLLLAGLYTFAMYYLLLFIAERMPGDLFTICQNILGKPGAWLVALFYLVMFWGNAVILLRQFTENTLLTALPEMRFELITAWYTLVSGILIFMGFSAIVRTSYFFLPYLLFGMLFTGVLLAPYYNIYRLVPWQGTGLASGLKTSIISAGYNVGVIALIVLRPSFQSLRTVRAAAVYGLGLSVGVKVLYTISYILSFGTLVGSEKSMPFYEMARLIYLSRYVQHIEALLIVLWVIVGMLTSAASLYVALYLLTRLLNLPALRPVLPLAAVTTLTFASLPVSFGQILELDALLEIMSAVGLYVIPVILFLATLYKLRKKSCIRG